MTSHAASQVFAIEAGVSPVRTLCSTTSQTMGSRTAGKAAGPLEDGVRRGDDGVVATSAWGSRAPVMTLVTTQLPGSRSLSLPRPPPTVLTLLVEPLGVSIRKGTP